MSNFWGITPRVTPENFFDAREKNNVDAPTDNSLFVNACKNFLHAMERNFAFDAFQKFSAAENSEIPTSATATTESEEIAMRAGSSLIFELVRCEREVPCAQF